MAIDQRSAAQQPAPRSIPLPKTSIYHSLDVSATRYPDKTAIVYYGRRFSYAEIRRDVDALAGYLMIDCNVQRGDRVLLYLQNSPQFVIAYYAVLRANAVVIPVNPMNLSEELEHYVEDGDVTTIVTAAELMPNLAPLIAKRRLEKVVVATYGDYADRSTDLRLPDVVAAARVNMTSPQVAAWSGVLELRRTPGALLVGADDIAVMPYTSGTTGKPKGCIHTHGSLMAVIAGAGLLNGLDASDILLAVVPFFHVTGMQMVMNNAIFMGAELVIMTRWDRQVALTLIERERVTSWINIPTMVIDFLANPDVTAERLASLHNIGGGGAAMPEAVATRLHELTGMAYIEGYGLTETAAPTHSNPLDRPKRQCLGQPIFNTHSRIIDPETLEVLPANQVGEIVSSGPQIFQGYWNNPGATSESFIDIDGRRYFRTGDLGYFDDEGYFFLVDRLKRMINASGFKVWPAEVESMLYAHPAIQEACVIGSRDPRRGETVKAVVVLKDHARKNVGETDIVDWAKDRMATYKAPKIVEFVDALPKTPTGKVQWRVLQEAEYGRQ